MIIYTVEIKHTLQVSLEPVHTCRLWIVILLKILNDILD